MRIRKSAEQRKGEIIEAALKLADAVGPERLTTERIAREVGITQPAVFRHFPRKHAIWQAVVDWIGARLTERWNAAAQDGGAPPDMLRALVRAQLDLIRSTPAIPAILFSRELHAKNRVLREAVLAMMGRFHEVLTKVIDDGRRHGQFRQDMDAGAAAYAVIALVQGTALRWSLSGRRFNLVAEGAGLLQLLLGGLEAPAAQGGSKR